MSKTSFDAERTDDDDRFSAVEVFRSDRQKTICGFFEPGQFIPVHAPASDIAVVVQSGTGVIRDGEDEHRVEPGDVVVVDAETNRGIKADDARLEALMVVSPPPTDEEHGPVREGLERGEFDPTGT